MATVSNTPFTSDWPCGAAPVHCAKLLGPQLYLDSAWPHEHGVHLSTAMHANHHVRFLRSRHPLVQVTAERIRLALDTRPVGALCG